MNTTELEANVRYGAFITTTHWPGLSETEVFDNSTAYADAAEQLGFSDVWLLEHHFTRYGLCTDALDMAAFLLGHTSRIDIGSAIIPLPLVHPVRLAERVAMLDHLSKGRFLFGIGRGDFPRDFEVIGQDIAKSHLATRASWEIIQRAWSGPVDNESGEFWPSFTAVNIVPKPRTSPRPRMYCAASSPSSIEWAASHGIPIMLLFYLEDELKKSNIELWGEVAASHGYDPSPAQHVIAGIAHVADTTEQARAEIADRFIWWATESDNAQEELSEDPGRKKANYEFHYGLRDEAILHGAKSIEDEYLDKLFRLCPIGSTQYCVDRLSEQLELLGVRHFVAGFEGIEGRENAVRSMHRFIKQVAPKVSERLNAVCTNV